VGSFFLLLTARIVLPVSSGPEHKPDSQSRPGSDGHIKRMSDLLRLFAGHPDRREEGTLRSDVLPLVFMKPAGIHASTPKLDHEWERMAIRARVIVAYAASGGKEVVGMVLEDIMRIWGDPSEVKYGLMGRGACEPIRVHL
jgi:hypothetical protein